MFTNRKNRKLKNFRPESRCHCEAIGDVGRIMRYKQVDILSRFRFVDEYRSNGMYVTICRKGTRLRGGLKSRFHASDSGLLLKGKKEDLPQSLRTRGCSAGRISHDCSSQLFLHSSPLISIPVLGKSRKLFRTLRLSHLDAQWRLRRSVRGHRRSQTGKIPPWLPHFRPRRQSKTIEQLSNTHGHHFEHIQSSYFRETCRAPWIATIMQRRLDTTLYSRM